MIKTLFLLRFVKLQDYGYMSNMKILITGFAGFIGSHLTEAMVKLGHDVFGLDDFSSGNIWKVRDILDYPNFRYKKGDIRDWHMVDFMMRDMDVVFHLAAQIHVDKSYVEPELTYEVNVRGTQNILEAAKWYDVRVIYASSSEVYGSAMGGPIDESHPLNAPHPYGASKIAADRMCYAYAKTFGMNIRIMRFFNIFGPRQKDRGYGGVISLFIRLMMAGRPVMIYGEGTATRDYTYITDAIGAYISAFNQPVDPDNFVINIGTGKEVTIKDIAQNYLPANGFKYMKPVFVEPRIGEVDRLVCNPNLAKQVLDWEPKISFPEGLDELVKWYKQGN